VCECLNTYMTYTIQHLSMSQIKSKSHRLRLCASLCVSVLLHASICFYMRLYASLCVFQCKSALKRYAQSWLLPDIILATPLVVGHVVVLVTGGGAREDELGATSPLNAGLGSVGSSNGIMGGSYGESGGGWVMAGRFVRMFRVVKWFRLSTNLLTVISNSDSGGGGGGGGEGGAGSADGGGDGGRDLIKMLRQRKMHRWVRMGVRM
jgi:hypothetical protein